jgi:phosphoribosylanthranilate isomerase
MVKICGITSQADADAAIEAGASALGFNFYRQSPRYLSPATAAAIRTTPDVLRVGIFVDESPADVAAVAAEAVLDIVQLHGSENPRDYAPLRIWKAFRVTNGTELQFAAAGAEAVLLDGPSPGSGEAFDWSLAQDCGTRLILAGGLDPENVKAAIEAVRPWGVDACSRLESAPGIKDHKKLQRFVAAARMAKI